MSKPTQNQRLSQCPSSTVDLCGYDCNFRQTSIKVAIFDAFCLYLSSYSALSAASKVCIFQTQLELRNNSNKKGLFPMMKPRIMHFILIGRWKIRCSPLVVKLLRLHNHRQVAKIRAERLPIRIIILRLQYSEPSDNMKAAMVMHWLKKLCSGSTNLICQFSEQTTSVT